MARILQIRRGTAAQNDAFTGMPGELTFDTDTKTLRVHDGVRLGGYTISNTNENTSGTTFDPDDIPDTIWAQKIAQFAPTGPTILTSAPVRINNGAYFEYIFDTDKYPIFAAAYIQCQSPECGYAIGDMVASFGIGTHSTPRPNAYTASDGMHTILPTGGENFWVYRCDNGQIANITNENWRLVFRVYC